MAYTYTNSKGTTFTLHRTTATMKNGQQRVLHYFGREAGPNSVEAVPAGYVVVEAPSGMPVLKKG